MRHSIDTHGGIVKGGGYAPLHVQSTQKWELFWKFPFLLSSCRHFVDSVRRIRVFADPPYFFFSGQTFRAPAGSGPSPPGSGQARPSSPWGVWHRLSGYEPLPVFAGRYGLKLRSSPYLLRGNCEAPVSWQFSSDFCAQRAPLGWHPASEAGQKAPKRDAHRR